MPLIDRALLDIPPRRQRKDIPNVSLQELKTSILATVLLHAPVVQKTGERYLLVAGERRTRAIDLIAADGASFVYDNQPVPPGQIPIVNLSEAFSEVTRSEIELAENVVRVELPWQDRIAALAFIHQLKSSENPKQTMVQTAKEIIAEGSTVTGSVQAASTSVGTVAQNISRAQVIAKHLDNPEIAKARNETEAFNLIIANENRAFEAELIQRGKRRITSIEVRHGSAFDILPGLEVGTVDTVFCDPPYGINVNTDGFRSRTVVHHNYDDSPDAAKALCQLIISEGFRVCKPRANLFMFCDIDLFGWLKDTCARAGWEPFRTPITWGKSDSEGMAPWGREGFRRTTEWLLFARKGQKGLFHSPIDYLRFNRVARDEREYGPEKPVDLIEKLLAASTLPGDLVLDPCCGSGSTLMAAKKLQMRALGIETDKKAFDIALVNSQKETPKPGLEGL